jgi:hypothetical protein
VYFVNRNGKWQLRPASEPLIRGGGFLTIAFGLAISIIWMMPAPIWLSAVFSWLLSACYWWASLGWKKLANLAAIAHAIMLSLLLWTGTAICLILFGWMMTGAAWQLGFPVPESHAWMVIVFSGLALYALAGFAFWLWMLGMVIAANPASDTGQKALRNAAQRLRSDSRLWMVGIAATVWVIMACIVVQFIHSIMGIILIGLATGWIQARCFRQLRLLQQFRELPASDTLAARRKRGRRWYLAGIAFVYLLMFGYYAALLGSTDSILTIGGWRMLIISLASGALIAFVAWLIAYIKPLYWLVLTILFIFVAVLFAGNAWLLITTA